MKTSRQSSRILREKNCRVVITGGHTDLEREYGEALSRDGAADNLVGTTTLKQLVALFEAADLVVCPDSGPAHMATAVNTAVLRFVCDVKPGPYGTLRLARPDSESVPGAARTYLGKSVDKLRWGQRVRHPDAMQLITIDDVYAKIDDFFDF